MNSSVRMRQQRPDVIIVMLRESGALPRADDRIEQGIAKRFVADVGAGADRAPHRVGCALGAGERRTP